MKSGQDLRIRARQSRSGGVAGGRLTTHVLDTASGKPAAGMTADLLRVEADGALSPVRTVTTNADGRVDGPLLSGEDLRPGTYELRFHAGDYLRASGLALPDPAFLDVIPIRFGIADPGAHYHVPLLVSPYGYATYRGS
jgi:5-hydroxyisourate hydrolase